MGTTDDIKRMQQEGKSEVEIMEDLRKRGIPEKEIIEVLAQNQIKDAVSSTGKPGQGMPPLPAPPGQAQMSGGAQVSGQMQQGEIQQQAQGRAEPMAPAPGQPLQQQPGMPAQGMPSSLQAPHSAQPMQQSGA